MKEKVIVLMPRLGYTTGEMPHLRNPPKNDMPGQMLDDLDTACRNLGCGVKVVDSVSEAPVALNAAGGPP